MKSLRAARRLHARVPNARTSRASGDCYISVLILLYCYICVLVLLYMGPRTAIYERASRAWGIYVSSYCYICVLMLLCVLVLLYMWGHLEPETTRLLSSLSFEKEKTSTLHTLEFTAVCIYNACYFPYFPYCLICFSLCWNGTGTRG